MQLPMQTDPDGSILALDVGAVRVGLALANNVARLAHPAGVFQHDETLMAKLRDLCEHERVTQVVIGLPRGLNGQETSQTAAVRSFADELRALLPLPQYWQDEAVTSAEAEAELNRRGKPYGRPDIDALAATLILEDYLHEHL